MKAYREDLAYIHDVGFGAFTRAASRELLTLLRRRGIHCGLIVDLGCGSGIWTRSLVDAGYEVCGVDFSPAMIRLARRRVPEGRFHHGSFLSVPLPECQAVTALGECFNYLFDDTNGLSRLSKLFARIYRSMQPGGLLIFDVAVPGRGDGPALRNFEGRDWEILVAAEEDRKKNLLTRHITSYRKVGSTYRRSREVHQLRLYSKSTVARALRRAGFHVRILKSYGRQRLPGGCAGFLARKP